MMKILLITLIALHSVGFSEIIRLKNLGYDIYWDTDKTRPLYSRHKIFKFKPTYYPRSDFEDDRRVQGEYTPNEFYGTGYDRGHLVPFADLLYNEATAKETFLMTNIVPQKAELNRDKWLDLERYLRHRCKKDQSFTIYTGPIYESDKIPMAFFKIAINDQTKEADAYVLPNLACNASLKSYKTTVQAIEAKVKNKIVNGTYKISRQNKSHHWLVIANILFFGYLLYRKKR